MMTWVETVTKAPVTRVSGHDYRKIFWNYEDSDSRVAQLLLPQDIKQLTVLDLFEVLSFYF